MSIINKILVTGCDGDIGLGIGRILREQDVADRILGCDMQKNHPGNAFFDDCYTLVPASSSKYPEMLLGLIEKENIDIVIPSSETELRILFTMNFYGQKKRFLTPNVKAMKIGFDKYDTIEMLRMRGIPHPWTVIADGCKPLSFPCVMKPRIGCGSKQVFLIEKEDDVRLLNAGRDCIFQEYLEETDEEYTCGLFRSRTGKLRKIIFRRRLKNGGTERGVVVYNRNIEEVLDRVAQQIDLIGSVNVQLRLKNGVPYIFEINPRFSSTVAFRHMLGFRDLIWSLEDCLNLPIDEYIPPIEGTQFYRIYDYFIDWNKKTTI